MDTPVQELHRFYFDAMLVPGLLSFALVVLLVIFRGKYPDTARAWLWAVFAAGFLGITCVPHAWQILFPEPCVIRFSSPTDMCFFSPSARLQVGVFFGVLGAVIAFLIMKLWRITANNFKHESPPK